MLLKYWHRKVVTQHSIGFAWARRADTIAHASHSKRAARAPLECPPSSYFAASGFSAICTTMSSSVSPSASGPLLKMRTPVAVGRKP